MKNLIFTWKTEFIFRSMLAGMLIAMAGGTYLSCQALIPDATIAKVVGAFLFSIGLIGVIALEANLFTGKVGYIDSWHKFGLACAMLVYNLLIAGLIGLLYKGLNFPMMTGTGPFGPDSARALKPWYNILFDGFGCGVLIYLAVELYRKTKSFLPVIMCVMAFILSGTEHCIPDAFYLGASEFSWIALGKLGLVILGNAGGAVAIHWLQVGAERLDEIPNNL
jgi:formate/nitrite transporter FocA (FNT family)